MTDSIREAQDRFQQGTFTMQDLQVLGAYYEKERDYLQVRHIRIAAKRVYLKNQVQKDHEIRIQVVATSDDEKNEFRKFAWGDFWLQYELIQALGQKGFLVTRERPHITLHLFGFPRQIPQQTYNIAWCTSHPELLTGQTAFLYDQIFTLGRLHAEKLSQEGFDAQPLHAASSKTPYLNRHSKYPAVFIGNSKPRQPVRPSVQMLKDSGYPFLVWGWGWEDVVPQDRIAGHYFDYNKLQELYACSAFVLNDHHQLMSEMGMLSPKNFDICSSGGFLVCERNKGVDDIFGDCIPQFDSVESLKDILFGLDKNIEKKEALREKATTISLEYTFDKVVDRLTDHLQNDCQCSLDFLNASSG